MGVRPTRVPGRTYPWRVQHPASASRTDPLAASLSRVWRSLPAEILGLPRETFLFVMLWTVALSFGIAGVLGVIVVGFGSDSHAYFLAWHGEMYDKPPGARDAYLYSPAFAQAVWPLTLGPWPLFALVFSTGAAVTLVWLLWPIPLRYRLPLLVMCLPEVVTGNIFWLLALVAVLGFRYPALWALAALTKVLPALGPVWFAARAEWRKAAVAAVATLVIVAASAASTGTLWWDWATFLLSSLHDDDVQGSLVTPPLWLRVPAALCLTIYAARRDQPRWLPVAMLLATPMLGHGSYALLAAVPRLGGPDRTAPTGRPVTRP